nr:RNA-directed DNA polymerase, eukaryota [Tanacetum cinerariifolium]
MDDSEEEDNDVKENNDDGSKDNVTGVSGNDTDVEEVPKTEFEEVEEIDAKVVKQPTKDTMKYPPGFIPTENQDVNVENISIGNAELGNKEGKVRGLNLNIKGEGSDSVFHGTSRSQRHLVLVRELYVKNKVNFLALQEIKMENIDLVCVRSVWGNVNIEFVHSESVGYSGGILCAWDPRSFCKRSAIVLDSFIMVRGVWRLTSREILFIVVYAPHEPKEKHILWEYLIYEICKWNGNVVTMVDFNEVRYKSDMFGSMFNQHGAKVFNSFITRAGLVEVPLGGSNFTWCHRGIYKDELVVVDEIIDSGKGNEE